MEYLVQIIATSCSFVALLLCLIFVFSKRFYLWFCALLVNALVFSANVIFLNSLANSKLGEVSHYLLDYVSDFLSVLSFLLLVFVIVVRIVSIPKDTQERIEKASKAEAKYVTIGPKAKENS